MTIPQEIQVQTLDHLGIIAGILVLPLGKQAQQLHLRAESGKRLSF